LKFNTDLAGLKNKVLTEFYNTGRVDRYYFKKQSNNKVNPLKHYISNWLKVYGIFNTQHDYIDDFYQMLFVELWRMDDKKFADKFFKDGKDLNIVKLCGYACTIIKLKGFYRLTKLVNGEERIYPKHSLMTYMLHGSALAHDALSISPIEKELDEDDKDQASEMVLYQQEDEDTFFDQYNFTVEDILERLTPDEKQTFYEMIGTQPKGKRSKETLLKRELLSKKIKDLKEKLR